MNRLVQIRTLEVELALDVAYTDGFEVGRTFGQQPRWGQATTEADAIKRVDRRDEILQANLKLINSAGQAVAAMGNGLEAIAHLVDNMGKLS